MNYSTSVFLINPAVRAIRVIYDPNEALRKDDDPSKLVFKTFDTDVKKDDFVVVPTATRVGFTVVKVAEVDVDIDFDSKHEFMWVVARVDKTDYDRTVKEEEEAIRVVKSAEIRKKREDLAAAMLKDHQAAIEGLAIANVTHVPPGE